MGCFLGCFGGSKDRRRRKKRNKVIPREQQLRNHEVLNPNPLEIAVSTEQCIRESSPPTNLVSEIHDKPDERLSTSAKKKVTFNSNITTFEHVALVYESNESLPDCNKLVDKETLSKSSNSQSTSGDDSVASSVGSYPPNHRYQNCRDSDDEAEECGDSDLDEIGDNEEYYTDCEDDGDVRFAKEEVWSESVLTASMESTTEKVSDRIKTEEVESPMPVSILNDQEVKTIKLKGSVRDRSDYVHPVLNPVENLSQWKTVKSRGTPRLKPQKENFTAELEADDDISCSSEPTLKQSSLRSHPKSDRYKNPNQEVAVDASLSSWLSSPASNVTKASPCSSGTVTSGKVCRSPRSFEDRPILGALTVDELKHLSATSSPRKSPSRSPDDMPIIGTVGTYWNEKEAKDSRPASAFKGIPNTTSKYREDKVVNWHSTPFETRLERALNNAGQA